jgi:CheY-like chemotaxis protein
VLVVEDDAETRAEMRAVLADAHYLVLEAADGREALEVLRSQGASEIRLILLDLLMPCMSGWELTDILRSDPKLSRIPILVTSGLPLHGDTSGLAATTFCLRKPFGLPTLLDAVSKAIGTTTPSEEALSAGVRQKTQSHPDR